MENNDVRDALGPKVLTRSKRLSAIVAFISIAIVAAAGTAGATTGVGNGGCGDSASAAIIACGTSLPGVPGLPGGPGTPGGRQPAVRHRQPRPDVRSSGTARSAPAAASSLPCHDVRDPEIYTPPAPGSNPDGAWYLQECGNPYDAGYYIRVLWLSPPAASSSPTPPVMPAPSVPAAAGAAAASLLRLPTPTLGMNPSVTAYVNLPEWLWIGPGVWHPYTTTAAACAGGGCSTATATATPVEVEWTMGNGAVVDCGGPGNAYDPGVPATEQTPSCSYIYTETSLGQYSPDGNPNDAAYRVTATVVWSVSWSFDGAVGTLPDLTTTAATWLRVAQIQSVITAGNTTQP